LPAPLLYLRPELFLEEDFFAELFFAELFLDEDFFAELFFDEDFRPVLFLLDDFFEDDLRPEDFFLLLAFLVAIWVLPPVKLEHSCTNFVASQNLRSTILIPRSDWSVLRN
jgi:hypothetical protein